MKWELDDNTLLKVSGVAALAYGLSAAGAPRNFHDVFMTSVSGSQPATLPRVCHSAGSTECDRIPRLGRGRLAIRSSRARFAACVDPVLHSLERPCRRSSPIALAARAQSATFSEPNTRYAGIVGSWLGSQQLVLSARNNSRVWPATACVAVQRCPRRTST